MKRTLYIAGKITGDPAYREKFRAAALQLEKQGFEVLNPATLPAGLNNAEYMRICAAMLDTADGIYLLQNWKESPGAQIERQMAEYAGKVVLLQEDPLDDLAEKFPTLFHFREDRPEIGYGLPDAEREQLNRNAAGYKGFLLLRCPACGDTKGFCVRSEIQETRCRACGTRYPVADLLPLFLNCPACGDTFKYYTNIDEALTWPCLTCKTPVDMEPNESGTAVVTRSKRAPEGGAAMPRRYERR